MIICCGEVSGQKWDRIIMIVCCGEVSVAEKEKE